MNKALATIALVAALAGGVYWVVSPSPPPEEEPPPLEDILTLDFPPFHVHASTFEERWTAEQDRAASLAEGAEAFISAWHRHNYAVGVDARGLLAEGDVGELADALERERRTWAQLKTGADYAALSWVAFDRFWLSIDELLRMAETTDTPVESLLDDPLNVHVHRQYEAAGDFLGFALNEGLIGPSGERHASDDVFRMLFRYRWALDGAAVFPMETVLSGTELAEFKRWRVEDGPTDLAARLAAIDALAEAHPSLPYPPAFARAVAHASAGDAASAEAELRAAVTAAPENDIVRIAQARFLGTL